MNIIKKLLEENKKIGDSHKLDVKAEVFFNHKTNQYVVSYGESRLRNFGTGNNLPEAIKNLSNRIGKETDQEFVEYLEENPETEKENMYIEMYHYKDSYILVFSKDGENFNTGTGSSSSRAFDSLSQNMKNS